MVQNGSSCHGSAVRNPTSTHEDAGLIPGLSALRIQRCHELWCRSQMWLESCVAEAGGCSSNSTPSLGASICHGCSPKKKQKAKQINKYVHPPLLFLVSYVSCSKARSTVSDDYDELSHFIHLMTVTHSAPGTAIHSQTLRPDAGSSSPSPFHARFC